jgi:hypothetical protein
MLTATIVFLGVLGLVGGLILTLRSSAKTGLPPKDVLQRATQRARELDAKEKSAGDAGD